MDIKPDSHQHPVVYGNKTDNVPQKYIQIQPYKKKNLNSAVRRTISNNGRNGGKCPRTQSVGHNTNTLSTDELNWTVEICPRVPLSPR